MIINKKVVRIDTDFKSFNDIKNNKLVKWVELDYSDLPSTSWPYEQQIVPFYLEFKKWTPRWKKQKFYKFLLQQELQNKINLSAKEEMEFNIIKGKNLTKYD